MSLLNNIRLVFLGLALGCWVLSASAERITVAVAANFTVTMNALAEAFERDSDHTVVVASGSTGKHYAQILHGAPFDVFMAADSERPALLEENGQAVAGSRVTYAVGRLALWSPDPDLVDARGDVLGSDGFHRLAIANPRLAPYGEAARQVLVELGLYQDLRAKLVQGENIGQAYQFVHSGSAELGLVAYAQLRRPGVKPRGSYWLVPRPLHEPLLQQAVILEDSPAARALMAFLQSRRAQRIIQDFGYDIAEPAE